MTNYARPHTAEITRFWDQYPNGLAFGELMHLPLADCQHSLGSTAVQAAQLELVLPPESAMQSEQLPFEQTQLSA